MNLKVGDRAGQIIHESRTVCAIHYAMVARQCDRHHATDCGLSINRYHAVRNRTHSEDARLR
jgi:hypothetical protein